MKGFPVRYIVFDTETHQGPTKMKGWKSEHILDFGMAKIYDPDRWGGPEPVYHPFRSQDEWMDLIRSVPLSSEKMFIFAHNLGFDLRTVGMMRGLSDGVLSLVPPEGMRNAARYKSPMFVADGSPTMMRLFRGDGQQFMLIDTFNWFPVKLARIAAWMGLEKGEDPGGDSTNDARWDYCAQDVEILDRALRKLWGWMQCLRFPHFAPTPASQARHFYRMRFERKRVIIPEDREPLMLDRMGYFGGMTEVFHLGRYNRACYHVDVNGLYPHVMRGNPYPCQVETHQGDPNIYTAPDEIDCKRSTAEVYLASPETGYPVRGSDATLYCRGRVRTILTGPELVEAKERGDISRLGRYTTYKVDRLFPQYVDMFWKMRKQSDRPGEGVIGHACKVMLNSLHGKFGQRDGEWLHAGRTESPGYYGSGKLQRPGRKDDIDARVIDGHMFHRERGQEHEDSFVPIAAWCAAYGRRYMADVVAMLGRDNVLYQVVDALIVTQDGFDMLHDADMIDTGRLGDFKLVEAYEWVRLDGVNQMEHSHGSKHAGIRLGSDVIADGVWRVEEWQTLQDSLTTGNVCSVGMRQVLRESSRDYSRRHVLADGRTVPWEIDNWHVSPEKQSERPVRNSEVRGEKQVGVE